MSSMIIRNATHKINLSSKSGTYYLQRYVPGSPQDAQTVDGLSSNYYGSVAIDTFILDVVGKTRDHAARAVSELYMCLVEARDYWQGDYPNPVFIEANVPGSTRTLYATIIDFQFHELPDGMDTVNGNIIRQATIVITRKLWNELPPQDIPYTWRNSRWQKVADTVGWNPESEYQLATQYELPRRGYPFGTAREFTRYAKCDPTIPYHTIFLSSCDRGASLEWVVPYGNASTTPVAAEQYGENPYIFAAGSTGLPMFRTTARHNGIVLSVESTPFNALGAYPWYFEHDREGASYITTPDYVSAPFVMRGNAQSISTWRSRTSTYLTTWEATTSTDAGIHANFSGSITGTGYWVQLQTNDSTPLVSVRALEGHPPYAPTRPWLDVVGPDSALPQPVRIGLKVWTNVTDDTDGISIKQYMRENGQFNRLVIASMADGMTSSWGTDTIPLGFYNLDDDPSDLHNEYEVYLQNGASFGDDVRSPTGRAVLINPGEARFGTGEFTRYVSMTMPWTKGLYRAYLRYRVTGLSKPANANIHSRLSISKNGRVSDVDSVVRTQTHTISTDSDFVGYTATAGHQINVADFGVVKLGPDFLSPDEGYTIRVNIELGYSGDATSELNLALYDLILLPVNRNFSTYSGQRSPYPTIDTSSAEDNMPFPKNNCGLYIDGLSPSGMEATVWLRERLGTVTPGGWPVYSVETMEYWNPIGGNAIMLRPNIRQRIYFFMYKVGPDGVMTSQNDIVFSVNLWASKDYLTLPGVY